MFQSLLKCCYCCRSFENVVNVAEPLKSVINIAENFKSFANVVETLKNVVEL